MKRLFLLFALSGMIAKAEAQQNIVFEGTTDAKYNGEYVHIYNNALGEGNDSAQIVNGKFTIKRPFKEASSYYFYSGYQYRIQHGYSPFGVLVDKPGTIHFVADMGAFNKSEVTGSKAQLIYKKYAAETGPLEDAMMKTLYDKYGKDYVNSDNADTSTDKYKSLIKDYMAISQKNAEERKRLAIETIKAKPASFASVYLLAGISSSLSLKEAEQLYGMLNPAYKKGYFAQRIAGNISGREKSAVGSSVDDFTLNDPQGKPMKFSALRGKYVLIDFWGSWCGPCHKAFPRLKELYRKYHDKGFEILGLATESNVEAWRKDIVKSELPWLQVVDDKTKVSEKLFAITEYPTAVLVDPQGKIIARFAYNQEDLRDEKIASLLK